MWGRRKKTPPLVPGRDRARADYGTRPTYSYYASSGRAETPRSRPVRQSAEQTSRKRQPFKLQRLFILLYAGVAVVCIAKILLVMPQSKVVVVTDDTLNRNLPTDMYAKTADEMLRGSVLNMSKITLNTNGIANEIEQRYPELSSAVLAVPLLGNRPVLYVSPERPTFVLETKSAQYTIDSKGYVLSELIVPTQELVHLREPTDRTVKPGERYFAGSTVQFATTVVYQLQKANLPIEYLDLPADRPYELDAYL
ncbi:hypothetical protein KDA14_05615, partial [Candidatus Saccharibacteria bacterium]|nr:hypothetical protein [Candidatus Saccharibacteria bacterium]